jgi:hypothetical protein
MSLSHSDASSVVFTVQWGIQKTSGRSRSPDQLVVCVRFMYEFCYTPSNPEMLNGCD